jgi:hypothetical protein
MSRATVGSARRGPAGRKAVGVLALGGAGLTLLFWLLRAFGMVEDPASPHLAAFESAFPVADALLGCLLLLAGIGLLVHWAIGEFLLVVAASMALYLGILDVTFYWRHDLYRPWTGTTLFEGVINLVSVGGGAFGILYGWRLWRARWASSPL